MITIAYIVEEGTACIVVRNSLSTAMDEIIDTIRSALFDNVSYRRYPRCAGLAVGFNGNKVCFLHHGICGDQFGQAYLV